MDRRRPFSKLSDLTKRSAGGTAAILGLAVWLLAWQAPAQTLDSTLEDVLDDETDEQVQQQLSETIEETVESQVESDIAETIEDQVESDVTETVEQQIESGITESLESGIAESIEQEVQSGAGQLIEQDLDGAIDETLDAGLETVAGGVDDVEDGVEEIVENLDDAVQAAGDGPDSDDNPPAQTSESGAQTESSPERFVAALDDAGRAIERDVWVVLVPSEHADRIQDFGLTVRERRELGAMDRVLLRVDAPEDRDIVNAALELALDAPGTLVDFNHVYETGAETAGAGTVGLPGSSARSHGSAVRASPHTRGRQPAIGIIDSAVAADHAALRAGDVMQKDFVPFQNVRPLRHGTAVASILIGESEVLHPTLPGARLYAASVFFEDETGQSRATTASLVAALDWLAGIDDLGVVNMSLAGPENRVLEAAIDEIVAHGLIVVAAVGNNGPAGEPLYPAAYDTVVGVTAVDAANRIYHYANRGRHVMFSAPGVRVPVASSAGGHGVETGTSMAAPHAAAIIALTAEAIRPATPAAKEVLAALQACAVDLGSRDFDDVFGFGLIAAVE